jgi:TonB family protein
MGNGGRYGRSRRAFLGSAVLIFAWRGSAVALPESCDRYELQGLSVGSTLAAVRSKLGREGVTTRIARPGREDVTGVEYVTPNFTVYIEYDRRIDRKPEPRVDLLRSSIGSDPEALGKLRERWGPPVAGGDELSRGLATGAAVWLDERCALAASVYRRQGSWWSGDVGLFVQLESLSSVARGESPASAAWVARSAAPSTSAAAVAAPAATDPDKSPPAAPPPPDRPAERIASVPPVYPPHLRLMGVRGQVSMAVLVGADGSVENVRVVEATPAGRGFEAAAVAAVTRWKFKPATQRGFAVASEVPVVIEFK